MRDARPNILLLMTDEQRWDALGGLPGSPVDTPYLEELRRAGAYFPHAYSACPVCVPARRTLMSGKAPAHHGVLMNCHVPYVGMTLPERLKRAGYQTHLCGKLHMDPKRKLYGFCGADWADGPYDTRCENDYARWLRERGLFFDAGIGHGMSFNGMAARSWHLEERYHFTDWCTERALSFLERRDPTVPFFLNVSYHQPHAPCCPPAYYFQKYMGRDLPPPAVGDWEDRLPNAQRGKPVNAWRVDPADPALREYRAGYFGCVEHIDHQIGRLLAHIPDDTIVLFTSDHGEMLGDHGWIRKRSAYEGSAHIPLFFAFPPAFAREKGIRAGAEVPDAVELMDLMPTILDLLDLPPQEGVDGLSLLPALRGEGLGRPYIHGECARLETIGSGMQYLTDGRHKYIWYPALGLEQFFDLENDPQERHDLAADPGTDLALWRTRLIGELAGRPEGFVRDGGLCRLAGPTDICIDPALTGAAAADPARTGGLFG